MLYQYFLRRFLLAIPTFLGATIVVFFIVQFAPGGPLEQRIMQLQQAAATETGGDVFSTTEIPPEAIEELKRFYGFDKPIYIRYLVWLGVYPRETDYTYLRPGEAKLVGDGLRLVLVEKDGQYVLMNADDPEQPVTGWYIGSERERFGEKVVEIYRKEFSGILTGNFGRSFVYQEPVLNLIKERIRISLQFGLIALILSYVICTYLGIKKALEHGTPFDFITSVLVFIGYSIPGWAFGAVMLILFGGGSFWDVFPLGGFQSPNFESLSFWEKIWDRAYHAILPTLSYTISSFATLTVLMKNSLLENLTQDYIRTAFAKGLSERRVIWLHAFRNSIIPVAANIGFVIGVFVTGSYFIELVFNIDGFGKLSFEAILTRDYPIVFSFAVIAVLIKLFGAILSDMVLAFVDPRIRFQ